MVIKKQKSSKKYRKISKSSKNIRTTIDKDDTDIATTKDAKNRHTYKYHPSEIKYRDLPKIPNLLRPGLRLIICGFNPGIQSSITGHRYAHFTNLFWPLMIESGIFDPVNVKSVHDEEFKNIKDIVKLLNGENAERYLFDNFEIGFTDLVDRPTKNISELTKVEMEESVPELIEKIEKNRPRMVCFIGKDIFKKLYRYVALNNKGTGIVVNLDKSFKWGSQDYFTQFNDVFNNQVLNNNHSKEKKNVVRFFVMPSTSGLVASISRSFKLNLFQELKRRYDSEIQ